MPKSKSTELTSEYQAEQIPVSRRSLAHQSDILVATKEIARLIDITPPRCAELFLAAGVDCVAHKRQTKLFWMGESLSRIAQHYAPAKLRKGEKKKKHTEIENEKVGALESRRIRKLDIDIAKSEEDWIPFDLAKSAVARFLQDARSVFTSCTPLLKQKHGNEIPVALYDSINAHLVKTYNMTCDIKIEIDTEEFYKADD